MKKVLLALALVFLPCVARAQTVTQTATWSHPTPVATVNTYQFTFQVNTGTPFLITPTCVSGGANVTNCTQNVTPLLANGDTLKVTAIANGQQASASTVFNPGPGPSQPTTVTIVIKVTVP